MLVLQTIEKLHRIRTNGPIASWSFYTQAFNTISIDAYVSKELNIPYCLKTKNVSKQTSSNNTHFAIAMEYRASPNGMTSSSSSLAVKLNSDFVFDRKKQDKESLAQLMGSVCTFMIGDVTLDTSSKNLVLIARQINNVFGFMQNLGSFSPAMTPSDLRRLVIFPTFLIHLPKILDNAIPVSKYFMQLILNLLIFAPPRRKLI